MTHFAVLVDYNVSLGVMILSFQLYHESIYVEFASRQYENNDIISLPVVVLINVF